MSPCLPGFARTGRGEQRAGWTLIHAVTSLSIGALVLGPLNYLRILALPAPPGVHRAWVMLVPVLLINGALVAKLLSENVRAEFGADE